MSMDIFLQHLLNGISVGSLYALIAIGYTMVYGILLLINFAHGDIFMMASYFMIFAMVDFGLSVWIALPLIIVLTIALGMLLERSAYKPLRNAPRMSIMISEIGASYLLENLAVYLFSGVPKGYPDIPWLTKVVNIGNISFQTVAVIAPILVILILAGLMLLVNHTKTGMAMRAVSKDFETARLMGIKIDRIPGIQTMWVPFGAAAVCIGVMVLLIHSSYGRAFQAIREDDIAAEAMGINLSFHKNLAFAVSSFFTAIGGGLYAALLTSVDPKQFYFTMTYNFLLIIVLGGMGSVTGTIIASFIITGGLEWLRFFDEPLSIMGVEIPVFRSGLRMVVFSVLLMVLVLFYRKGLMGQKEFSWDEMYQKFKN